MNIATKPIKTAKIETTEILILSEDSKSFLFYLDYFFCQYKIQKQKTSKELEIHKKIKKALPKFKSENKPRFYIITNPRDNKQLRIIAFHTGSDTKTIIDTAKKINKQKIFSQIYCVFDFTFKHKDKFQHEQYNNIIQQKEVLKKQKIQLINSVPSYEYWLLTHFKVCGENFSFDEELDQELNKAITPVKYKKNDPDLFKKLFQDEYKKILENAILRCKQQDQDNQQNQTPDNNPSSKIYEIIEYIKTFL
jgi:transketolase